MFQGSHNVFAQCFLGYCAGRTFFLQHVAAHHQHVSCVYWLKLDGKTCYVHVKLTVPVQPWSAVSVCIVAAAAAFAVPGSAVAAVSAPQPPLRGCSGTPHYHGYLPWRLPPAEPSLYCFRALMPWCWWAQGHVEEPGRCSGPDRNTNLSLNCSV